MVRNIAPYCIENVGIDSADVQTTATDDANGQDDGGNDITKRIDDLTAQIETLKKESSPKV